MVRARALPFLFWREIVTPKTPPLAAHHGAMVSLLSSPDGNAGACAHRASFQRIFLHAGLLRYPPAIPTFTCLPTPQKQARRRLGRVVSMISKRPGRRASSRRMQDGVVFSTSSSPFSFASSSSRMFAAAYRLPPTSLILFEHRRRPAHSLAGHGFPFRTRGAPSPSCMHSAVLPESLLQRTPGRASLPPCLESSTAQEATSADL